MSNARRDCGESACVWTDRAWTRDCGFVQRSLRAQVKIDNVSTHNRIPGWCNHALLGPVSTENLDNWSHYTDALKHRFKQTSVCYWWQASFTILDIPYTFLLFTLVPKYTIFINCVKKYLGHNLHSKSVRKKDCLTEKSMNFPASTKMSDKTSASYDR